MPFVYIMTNPVNTVLYTGVTNHIQRRALEHRQKQGGIFTATYHCVKLVYYQEFRSMHEAIAEEKRIKGGSRRKKIVLIESTNPEWLDLAEGW